MMKRISDICRRHAATLFWALALVLMWVELFVFSYEVTEARHVLCRAVVTLGDTFVMLVPYWWLPRKWRGLVLVPAWVMAVFYIANVLNMRFWGRLMPFMMITQAGNANGVLIDSALGVVRAGDLLYVAVPLVLTALWCVRPLRRAVCASGFRLCSRIDVTMLGVLAFLTVIYIGARNRGLTFSKYGVRKVMTSQFHTMNHMDPYLKTDVNTCHITFGQNYYILSQFGMLLSDGREELSQQEETALLEYCRNADPQTECRDINRGKNLVFLLVESLNADIVGRRVNGREITPNLNALARSAGTVSCLRVRPQIGHGNSADGQLMYNIGLLPTSVYVASADYVPGLYGLPSMARLLPDSTDCAAIFADHGNGWNKMEAYRNYGYDRIFNDDSIRAHTPESMSRDGAMLAYALKRIDAMERPFHLQLLTIQMHAPYNEPLLSFTDYTGLGMSLKERRYINCAADFDRQLGMFVKGLRERGLWDNTVLVIASDHNAPDSKRPDGSPSDIVFIAANAGRGERIEQEVHQIDVFPTVLDIMGVKGGWRGVGRSMLGPRRGSSDTRQAGVSDSLLRSDYFKAR